jgi:hypothetical protein
MFYPAGNNNSESLFAIQCTQDGYGYGNGRNVSLSRNSHINLGSSWGAGKGPTLSLQESFENGDLRRKNTFMRNGDHYSNIGGGGYTYLNSNQTTDPKDEPNEMLAHVRKYIIGADADCNGLSGATNQDAGNNIYLLRLADVYLTYVEACIGNGSSTSDALAVDVYQRVRARAGLTNTVSSITYEQLIKERRVEFALESINYFDIKRMSYRNMDNALAYINGMERNRQYVKNGDGSFTEDDRNAAGIYHGGFTAVDPKNAADGIGSVSFLNPDAAVITVTASQLNLPIPNETVAKTEHILDTPVDYEF